MAFSPNEEKLSIGFSHGKIIEYKTDDLDNFKQVHFRKNPITILKYSPDNKSLASTTVDETGLNVIDILNAENDNKITATLKGQTGNISAIDWSENGEYISASSDLEYRIFNIKRGVMTEKYALLKNERWATWTRNYGWPLMGYYDSGASKANCCERFVNKINNDEVLAIGDEHGNLKLFKYPILASNQEALEGNSKHALGVGNLKFADEEGTSNVIFTSGTDGCLYKWD